MAKDLQDLISQYLYWQKQIERAEEKLSGLKEEIVSQAKEKGVKKIKSGKVTLYLVTSSETRFPQLGEPGRREVEEIVKASGELKDVLVFDIVKLGNAYDERKLSKSLMKKLTPYAIKARATKIVVKEGRTTP